MLKTLSETVFSLVFPVSCELCAALLPPGGTPGVCRACRGRFRPIPAPHCPGCGRSVLSAKDRCGHCPREGFHFDRAFACMPYDENMKKLLHAFKFGRRRSLAPFFEGWMGDFLREHVPSDAWDLAVPVPMDPAHERERGFNQAKLLCAFAAKTFGKPYAPGVLGRRKGAAQSSLGKRERERNASGRFFVRDAESVASRKVLLVDDILTTGQTASACAKALKEAGAGTVTVLAVARGVD